MSFSDSDNFYPATAGAEAEREAARKAATEAELKAVPKGKLKYIAVDHISFAKRFREEMGDLDSLADSIREKGLLQPITVSTHNPDTGERMPKDHYWLLAGHRRFGAANRVGLKEVPALIRDVNEIIDAREIELFENIWRKDFTWAERCALVAEIDQLYKDKDSNWSGRRTAQLLERSVTNVARDIKLAKMLGVMPELAESKTADDAMKKVAKLEESVIVDELRKRQQAAMESGGEVHEHSADDAPAGRGVDSRKRALAMMLRTANANYRLGDVFKGLAECRTNGVVHLIECDPPYSIDLNEQKASKDTATSTIHGYNEISREEYPAFLEKLTKELYRVAATNSWMVFWFGPSWQHEVLLALRAAKWQVDEIPALWIKKQGQTMQPEMYFARCYEPFYLCRKGQPILLKRGRSNVFEFSGDAGAKKYHPTQRPLPLMREILSTLVAPTSIVLVPFLGSGATLRAAYLEGMSAFGWDVSGAYKDRFMLAVEEDTKALDDEPNAE